MEEINKKIKIANIVCAFPPYRGGIPTSAAQIAEILSDDFEVSNFHPDNLKAWLRMGHGAFSPGLFFKLKDFDIIYLHYPFFGTAEIVWLFKLFFKQPKLIIHYHMDVKNLKTSHKLLSISSKITKISLLKKADVIISASLDYIKSSTISRYYSQRPEQFKEIAFAINLNKFQPKEIKKPGAKGLVAVAKKIVNFINDQYIKKDKSEFIFVGGLDSAHYFKGLDNLIEALRLTPGDWKLTIVGDGNLRQEYETFVKNNALEKKIIFKGKLSDADLIKSYQESDCLILPSINSNEAFGIVVIEAMACANMIIASDLPGLRSVFENGKQGLLVEPNNIEDLRNKITTVIQDKNLRQRMSLAARDLAERKYDEKLMKKNLKQVIQDVIRL